MRYMVRTVSWLPERADNVEVIRRSIPNLESVVDCVGDGYASFFEACRRLNDTGGVMLEDDVLLCQNFTERLERIVSGKGRNSVINFFERPKVKLETALVGGSQFLWAQCVYLPPGFPNKCIEYYEEFRETRPLQWQGMATDVLTAFTLVKERMKYWRIRPTLVQHLPFQSAIGARPRNRQTPYFIDAEVVDAVPVT
jgi:hypothetical protein